MSQLALAGLSTGPEPLLAFTYRGKPAVKKNRQQIIPVGPDKRPLLVPPAEYRRAEKRAVAEIGNWLLYRDAQLPLDAGGRELHVRVLFYLGPRQRPDLDGLISACADILEAAGVIANDYRIVSWDGSRRLRDVEDPRTEVSIWEEP